jgi:hypothetical protein
MQLQKRNHVSLRNPETKRTTVVLVHRRRFPSAGRVPIRARRGRRFAQRSTGRGPGVAIGIRAVVALAVVAQVVAFLYLLGESSRRWRGGR